MFRANRVGTPVIYQANRVTSVANVAPSTFNVMGSQIQGHQINAAAALDFGMSHLEWIPAAAQTLAAATAVAYGQIITITQPISGDTVGVELNGAIQLRADQELGIIPFFSQLSSAAGGALGIIAGTGFPYIQIADGKDPGTAAAAQTRSHTYQEQVIINPLTVGLTCAHGFIITNTSAAVRTITGINFQMSVRQLNDQQNIGYRDTRR